MELFKVYSNKKANFFCLVKLPFITVSCLINGNVSLEANLEGQPFVGSNLEVEIFLKKRENKKRMR